MKRILGLAALLGKALSISTGFTAYGGARGGGKRYRSTAYFSSSKPADARWWHDQKNFQQSNVREAAGAKRQRKAEKLTTQTLRAWYNPAHTVVVADPGYGFYSEFVARLNPFYVAK